MPNGYKINTSTQADSKEGLYSKLFDTKKIEEVNINISENNLNYMLQNAINKPYVLADSFSIGNEKISNVGIKTEGGSDLKNVWNSDSDKFSFELNTSKFINKKGYGENQNFYGIERIRLNNIYGDASLMKEFISYELMTKMGVPTPYYSLVKLNINGKYYGIYNMKESLNSTTIKRTKGNTAGDLYKCTSPGGSLIYNEKSLDSLLDSNKEYKFNIDSYKDKDNALSSYKGILENKVYGTSINDCKGKEDTINKDCNELFTWMKKLNILNNSKDTNSENYKSQLEGIMDVDEVLRYFAVNTYLVNLNSYQSKNMDNYYFYLMDGKAYILPLDYNYSFGASKDEKPSDIINFPIDNPVRDTTLKERPLLNVLLQNEEYKTKYKSYLSDCAKIASLGGTVDKVDYKKDYVNGEIDAYKKLLDEPVKNDPADFVNEEDFTKNIDNLKTLNTKRAKAVDNQVKGDATKVSDDGVLEKSYASCAFAPSRLSNPSHNDSDDNKTSSDDSKSNTDNDTNSNGDSSNQTDTNNYNGSNNSSDSTDTTQNDYSNTDSNGSLDQDSNQDGKPSYDDSLFSNYGGISKTWDNNKKYIYVVAIIAAIGCMMFVIKGKKKNNR